MGKTKKELFNLKKFIKQTNKYEYIERIEPKNISNRHWAKIINIMSSFRNENFIKTYEKYINFTRIIYRYQLDEKSLNLLEPYIQKQDWAYLITRQRLSDEYMKKHKDKMLANIKELINYQILNEEFITNYILTYKDIEKVDWYIVCRKHFISIEIIEQMKEIEKRLKEKNILITLINWRELSLSRFLTLDFIIKYKENLNMHLVTEKNYGISRELREKVKNYLELIG